MIGHQSRAVSLVEIVVAGFLLLLVLNTMIAPLERGRHSAQQSHSRLDALRLASDLLSLSRSQSFPEVRGYSGMRTSERSNGLKVFLYRVDVVQPFPNFKELRIQVRWHEQGRLRLLEHGTGLQGEGTL